MKKVRKAVLPVAGLGTRLLPATKACSKELLSLIDKPTLEYIVEEAVKAGIEEFILVTSRSKPDIQKHFTPDPALEQMLKSKGKLKELEAVLRLQEMATYTFVHQTRPIGLGDAVLCAKEAVGDEPFVVLLGDNLVDPRTPNLPRMIEIYQEYGSSVLSLFTCRTDEISSYGIASVTLGKHKDAVQVTGLVEKPSLDDAPSTLAVDGCYILTPEIFAILEKTDPGRSGEVQLTDALKKQAKAGLCHALLFSGIRYDTGTPMGMLTTAVALGLQHPEIGPGFREYVKRVAAGL